MRMQLVLPALIIVLVACTAPEEAAPATGAPTPAPPVVVGQGDVRVEVAAQGLEGPTQVLTGPDGRLWVGQLAGEEGGGTGQVVTIDPDTGEVADVLVEGLDGPTGIAIAGDALWIAETRAIARAPLDGDGVGAVEQVLTDLPYNGRSLGTLTTTAQDTVLFDTSGRLTDGEVQPDSGVLWELDPADPTAPRRIAEGFKHAYAHVVDDDGTLWSTEMHDGRADGEVPPDAVERVADDAGDGVPDGGDHGWPDCVGDRMPVAERGADEDTCVDTVRPAGLLPPGATPTGLATSPWAAGELLVAEWTRGQVVTLAPAAADDPPAEAEPAITGLDQPQHLLRDGDDLYVSDHGTGTVWRVSPD